MKRYIQCLLTVILVFSYAQAYAGIYWLPDFLSYNQDNNGRSEIAPESSGDMPLGCEHYSPSCLAPKVLGGKSIRVGGDLFCSIECVCPAEYQYSSENCSAEYILGSSSCDGKSNSCTPRSCSEGGYQESPTAGWNCSAVSYAGRSCYRCSDPCAGLTDQTPCPYGCQTFYTACPAKCQSCYPDNCRNRTAVATPNGCQTYFEDCPSKCQTAYPDNCHKYSSHPSASSCANGCAQGKTLSDCTSRCAVGCKARCDTGYHLSSDQLSCVADACPSGYEAGKTCGEDYTLEKSGQSGSQYCGKCVTQRSQCYLDLKKAGLKYIVETAEDLQEIAKGYPAIKEYEILLNNPIILLHPIEVDNLNFPKRNYFISLSNQADDSKFNMNNFPSCKNSYGSLTITGTFSGPTIKSDLPHLKINILETESADIRNFIDGLEIQTISTAVTYGIFYFENPTLTVKPSALIHHFINNSDHGIFLQVFDSDLKIEQIQSSLGLTIYLTNSISYIKNIVTQSFSSIDLTNSTLSLENYDGSQASLSIRIHKGEFRDVSGADGADDGSEIIKSNNEITIALDLNEYAPDENCFTIVGKNGQITSFCSPLKSDYPTYDWLDVGFYPSDDTLCEGDWKSFSKCDQVLFPYAKGCVKCYYF